LFRMHLTEKQMEGMLTHTDSPYIRALGFLYLRLCLPPNGLWDWFSPYFDDSEEFTIDKAKKRSIMMGQFVVQLLLEQKHFSLLLPRIPVPIFREIQRKFKEEFPNLQHMIPGEVSATVPVYKDKNKDRDGAGDNKYRDDRDWDREGRDRDSERDGRFRGRDSSRERLGEGRFRDRDGRWRDRDSDRDTRYRDRDRDRESDRDGRYRDRDRDGKYRDSDHYRKRARSDSRERTQKTSSPDAGKTSISKKPKVDMSKLRQMYGDASGPQDGEQLTKRMPGNTETLRIGFDK